MLPPAFPCTNIIGEITPQAALETGLKEGTPVVICAGDVAVAQAGAGANQEGKVQLCIGTATCIGISTSKFRNNKYIHTFHKQMEGYRPSSAKFIKRFALSLTIIIHNFSDSLAG